MNAFFSVDPAQRKYCTFSFPDEENSLQTFLPKIFFALFSDFSDIGQYSTNFVVKV